MRLPISLLASALALPLWGATITFDFESESATSPPQNGALSTLSLTQGGLTLNITRESSGLFDVVNNTTGDQTGKPASWGSRSLDPFVQETLSTAFTLNFSIPIFSFSVDFGDFGQDSIDTLQLQAFSGQDATETLRGSSSTPFAALDFPAFATGSVSSSAGFLSVRMIGGTTDFPNSVFYDNIKVDTVPEPSTWLLIGTGALLLTLRRTRT